MDDQIKLNVTESHTGGSRTITHELYTEHRNTLPKGARPSLGYGLIDEKSLSESMILNQEAYMHSKTVVAESFRSPRESKKLNDKDRKMSKFFIPSLLQTTSEDFPNLDRIKPKILHQSDRLSDH